MCNDPTIFNPLSGCFFAYSSRTAISPGISCSASMISFRPHSARLMSATLYSSLSFDFAAFLGCSNVWVMGAPGGENVVSCKLSVVNGKEERDGRQHFTGNLK